MSTATVTSCGHTDASGVTCLGCYQRKRRPPVAWWHRLLEAALDWLLTDPRRR